MEPRERKLVWAKEKRKKAKTRMGERQIEKKTKRKKGEKD
jgi:hypothetical protein